MPPYDNNIKIVKQMPPHIDSTGIVHTIIIKYTSTDSMVFLQHWFLLPKLSLTYRKCSYHPMLILCLPIDRHSFKFCSKKKPKRFDTEFHNYIINLITINLSAITLNDSKKKKEIGIPKRRQQKPKILGKINSQKNVCPNRVNWKYSRNSDK